MKIYSQLESAQIENVTSDPTPTAQTVGRVVYRSDTDEYKICDSTPAWRTLFSSLDGSLTFTGLAAAPGTNPVAGDYKIFFKTDGNPYFLDSAGLEHQLGSGKGSLSTYYSEDVDLLDGSEFSCFDGGVIGAGTAIATFVSIDSATQLDGTKSLAFTIPATGTGKYALLNAAKQIVVPLYAQSKRQLMSFESRFDGNKGDISLFLWDTTNSATIKDSTGATLYIDPANGVNSNRLWFETSTTANLQWGVIINTPNTGKILTLDNLQIDGSSGKEISVYASSGWESFNGSFTNVSIGTGGSATFLKRRVGENQEISIYFNLGTGGSITGDIIFNLPTKMNTSLFGSQNFNRLMGSVNSFNTGGTGNSINARVIQNSTLDNQVLFQDNSSTVYNTTTPFSWGDNDVFFATFTYPVAGWSDKEDNVVVSGTKATYAYVECAGNGEEAITAGVTDVTFTEVIDNKGLWNGSQFTADRDMVVNISGGLLKSGNNTNFWCNFYVNGSQYRSGGQRIAASQDITHFSEQFALKKNDVLSVRLEGINTTLVNNSVYHHLTIKELPNYEDLILAYLDESSVVSSYISSAAQTFTSGVAADIIYETVVDDKNLDYNSTTGVYTAPVSGNYLVTASLSINKTVAGGTSLLELVPVNYTGNRLRGNRVDDSGSSLSGNVLTGVVNLKKGYQFKISYFGTNSGVITKEETQDANSFSIHRIR